MRWDPNLGSVVDGEADLRPLRERLMEASRELQEASECFSVVQMRVRVAQDRMRRLINEATRQEE